MLQQTPTDLQQKIKELDKRQDILDFFIRNILRKSALVYILINIIVCIWLAQSIFSSDVTNVPRSIYLVSPYFGLNPITHISVVQGHNCDEGFQKLIIKTFPKILDPDIGRTKIYSWFESGQSFCVRRLQMAKNMNLTEQQCNYTYCNGYCFQDSNDCPITKLTSEQNFQTDNQLTKFYTSRKGNKYYYSKGVGAPIVDIMASFFPHCAGDFHFYDEYKTLDNYFSQATSCSSQGTTLSFISDFESKMTKQFFRSNYIFIQPNLYRFPQLQRSYLGSVRQIKFKSLPQCEGVGSIDPKTYLFENPVAPTITQSFLIVGFVFFFLYTIVLLSYGCYKHFSKQRSFIVIFLAVIQMFVMSYIYNENKQLFKTYEVVNRVSMCLQEDITAGKSWEFGIQNSNSFIMVQYLALVYLLMNCVAFCMDKLLFGAKKEEPQYYEAQRNALRMGI